MSWVEIIKNRYFLIIWLFFVVSRFFFLSNYPHFYDSPEYLRESLKSSYFQSLSASHESVHPLWLFLSQLFQDITPRETSWELSLISAFFGLMAFLVCYLFLKKLFSKKIALKGLIPLIFFPHLWLIQTNILHESLDVFLFLTAYLFFNQFLALKRLRWFFLSVLFLALSIVNFVGIILWMPIFIGLVILKSKKYILKDVAWLLLLFIFSLFLSIIVLYLLLDKAIADPVFRLQSLFFGYGAGGIFQGWSLINLLRILRNDALILFFGYSAASLVAVFLTLFSLIRQKKWSFFIWFLSFYLPFLITGKFWYGGLFGRYSVLVAFPLGLSFALINKKKMYWFLLIILFISFSFTFLAYQKTPIPQIQKELIEKSGISKDDFLVLSGYQRPQLSLDYAAYVGGSDEDLLVLENQINEKLEQKKEVYISQQAINFPYWQYDGQQIHIISKGNKEKARLKKFLEDKKLTPIIEDKNYPLLSIYRIDI